MLLRQVALTCENQQVPISELTRVSAALQKQVTDDFSPLWGVQATVDAFPTLEDVPLGYLPVVIVDQVEEGAGVHSDDKGQPFALVEFGKSWSLTASHETLEMLADPSGNRLVAGPSPDPEGPSKVEFLVEVCDPCEAEQYAYLVNGVLVSDFYTPDYFDPQDSNASRYSFKGSLTAPRQVLPGGYLSWHDPVTDHWFQELFLEGDNPTFKDLGVLNQNGSSLRSMIDGLTPPSRKLSHLPARSSVLKSAVRAGGAMDKAARARASRLRAQIAEILKKP